MTDETESAESIDNPTIDLVKIADTIGPLYAVCIDCETTWDIWKFDEERETGVCPGCGSRRLRALTEKEFERAYRSCVEAGCFAEAWQEVQGLNP